MHLYTNRNYSYILLFNFRHKRTSSNKSATSFSSIGEVGENSATGIRLTSPSMSSNVQLLKEGPELNYGGKNIKKHKIFVMIMDFDLSKGVYRK